MRFVIFLALLAGLQACDAPETANQAGAGNKAGEAAAPPEAVPDEPAANRTLPAAPAAAPSAPASIPLAFQGRYDESREACGRPSEYRLTVEGDELRFHESIGRVRAIAAEGPRSLSVTADYEGEGESWSNVRRLRLSDDGGTLTITGEGITIVRQRCR